MAKQKQTSSDNCILAYYQQIMDGSVVVGEYVKQIYTYLVKGLEDKSFYFDQKKAAGVIEWIETHCRHTEGKLATQPFLLELWQKAFLSAVFGIVDEKGLRQFREVLLVIGRKNGKSLIASAMGRYIWENEGFGTRVFNVAPKLEQADLVYDNIWVMTTLDPEWQEKKRLSEERDAHKRKINEEDGTMQRHRQSDLYIPAYNSTCKKIAFSAKKSDGFNPSLCICDEIAAWDSAPGLKQYDAMKSGMGAREEPLLLSISTANYINDGIYDELMLRSTRFLNGESKERRLLPIIYSIDDPDKWNDINELRKSNPNMGVSVSVDYFLDEIAIAEGSLAKKSEFLTKYCNIKQNSSVAWLDSKTISKCVSEELKIEDFEGCYAVMGIDLSRTTDLTAVVLLIEKDGIIHTFSRFYLPTNKLEEATQREGIPYGIYEQRGWLYPSGDNFIDYHDVFDWAKELIEKHKIYILEVGYDRYSSQYLINDMKEYGFHCDDVFQGYNLSGVIDECEGMFKDGKVKIGNNDLMKMHFYNSALKMNAENGRKQLIKVEQRAHIDGMAAFLCGMTVRQKYWNEIGRQLSNERR